jgi:hypothetical protein
MTGWKNELTANPTVVKSPKRRISRRTMCDGYNVTVFTSRVAIFSEFEGLGKA